MTKRTLTIEDLRIDPDELRRFAEQLDRFREPPPPAERSWEVPKLILDDNTFIQPDWNDGPMVKLVIQV